LKNEPLGVTTCIIIIIIIIIINIIIINNVQITVTLSRITLQRHFTKLVSNAGKNKKWRCSQLRSVLRHSQFKKPCLHAALESRSDEASLKGNGIHCAE